MNTADRETAQNQAHDHRRLLRDRSSLGRSASPSPNPSSISRSKPKQRQRPPPKLGNGWYAIRDIIEEKAERGRIRYLIDWEGSDPNGQPYEPTWEPAENVTSRAIDVWRNKKHEAAKATSAPDQDEENENSLALPSTNETDPAQAPKKRKIVPDSSANGSFGGSSGRTGEGSRNTRKVGQGSELQGPPIVIALPCAPLFDASEYQAVSVSQSSQTSSQSQITLPERMHPTSTAAKDQRVIPDSQEISGTSVSEAHNSYYETVGSFRESQFSQPSHQPESRSRFAGISGYFVNPTISTNLNASSQFQTQLDFDLSAVGPTPTRSHSTTIPESLPQNRGAPTPQVSQENENSQYTNGGSTTSNSQAAQIVRPLSSHPGDTTSPSQSVFSVFEDRTVPETTSRNSGVVLPDSQDPSQALSEIAENIRISTSNMEGTSAAEALRLYREAHFRKAGTGSASPAVASPVPLDNAPPAVRNQTPQVESHVDSQRSSPAVIDAPALVISPALLLQTGPSFQPAQANVVPDPPLEHMPVDPVSSYDAPQLEQPTTLDPSTLTLSIENDVEGSPSVPTEDGSAPGPHPESTNSDEDEMQENYPRSLLPHVPTGPSEYLITLPFQTSSRPQYNDIIRENEGLMNMYASAFQVLPHQTPRKDLVEKLDAMFSRLFDICDFPPFLDTLPPMSPEQTAKHVIGTNAKFSFVAELLDDLQSLNSDKKVLIFVRSGQLMDLLGHVIQTRGYRYIRSGKEVVGASDARHPLTVYLCSTSEGESSIPRHVDAVIAFDHTFRQELVSAADQSAPVILALVNTASIQHINMRIMENLQPLERKNVLMLALVKAMRYVEEPDSTESLYSIAGRFARRIQLPEDEDDEFYYEPQPVPIEIFEDLYAASSQIEGTQLSGQSLGADLHPENRKRSYLDGENEGSLPKRPKIIQPEVVTSLSHISDAVKDLLGSDLPHNSEENTIVVPVDRLQAVADKIAALMSELKESKARENEFRQLSDRNQKEANSFRLSINNIQRRYMDALEERGIFEANCKAAQEQAAIQGRTIESCRTEITTLKTTRTELEKKLAEANNALLQSSYPDLVKLAELDKNLGAANAQVEDLNKRLIVSQSDADYNKNLWRDAAKRATELAAENRAFEKKIEELQHKADSNIIAVNKTQSRIEGSALAQQITECKNTIRERDTELNHVREENRSLRSGRRETRQSSVPRSPRMGALSGMSPRNGTRGPSAMGGPSSSRGGSPQPPSAVFDGPPGSGNGIQNAALLGQSPGGTRLAHLREQRF
ncbi:hypothetical protein F5Y08DRAFT_58770 [Xylaria arbuscula]|nr:hypothetical protein F5Y08DRAFT_58770 [Xylaria arbuscula]